MSVGTILVSDLTKDEKEVFNDIYFTHVAADTDCSIVIGLFRVVFPDSSTISYLNPYGYLSDEAIVSETVEKRRQNGFVNAMNATIVRGL
jgi:hypothetical protein